MSKKPKNTSNDDFDFMSGGSEEFFPLENPGNKGGTPPKGVKGYLKNVAKSVLNLGVKVNKSLYPEAFSLADNIKELGMDDTGNVYDIKGIINKYTQKAKNLVAEGKKIGKEIVDDAKTSIKTGYYVKTEDEDSGFDDMMSDMFGDFGDMGGSDWGDDYGDDLGDSGDSEESSTPKRKGRISSSEATVKSTMASTKALLKSGQKQQAAIIGAAQSHIRHETEIFAQQIQLSQYQHRQKMNVMKNIANNLVKVIDQNNIKLKAQMEYSAKSLAFTQDINSMLKEIREAQFTLIKPKEKKEVQESARSKIFGSGTSLNMNQWVKQIKNQFGNSSVGSGLGMLGDLKGAMSMMTDMGMSSTQAVKMMISPMILQGITNSLLTNKTRDNIELANMKMQGFGTALNTQLGKIARGNNKVLNNLRDWANSQNGGIMSFIGNLVNKGINGIEGAANTAHVKDDIRYQTDRFRMGNPDEIHPFDNKAHKALTEIIPSYLSQISAGVNHTEETTFDWDSNKFITKRAQREKIKNVEDNALSYVSNLDNMRESFVAMSSHKKSNLGSVKNLDKVYNTMMKNYLSQGLDFSDETLKQMVGNAPTNEGYEPTYIGEMILANTGIVDDLQKYEALKNFRKHINKARPHSNASIGAHESGLEAGKQGSKEYQDAFDDYVKRHVSRYGDTSGSTNEDRMNWIRFQTSASAYRGNASSDYFDLEERFSKGNSIDYQNSLTEVKGEGANYIRDIDEKIKNLKTRLNRIRTIGGDKKQLKLIPEQIEDLERQKLEIQKNANLRLSDTNSTALQRTEKAYLNMNNSNEFENFRISSLEDDTTHGLVQNIYNLLLSGIDVYTTPKSNDPNDPHNKMLSGTKATLGKNNKEAMKIKISNQDSEKYLMVGSFPDNPSEYDAWITENFGANYKGHIYWKEGNSWKSEYLKDFTPSPGVIYYKSISEYNGYRTEELRKDKSRALEADNDPFFENKDMNYNVFQKIHGKLRKGFSGLQDLKSGIINGFMGKMLYDEEELYRNMGTDTESKADDTNKDKVKGKGQEFFDFAKGTYDNASSKASDLLKERVAKELSGRLNNLEVNGTTLTSVVESINDPAFKEALKTVKSDVSKQTNFLIEQANVHKELQPYVQELTDVKKQILVSSSTKGAMSVIVNNMRTRLKTGFDKRLEPVARKLLTGKLLSIKVGDKRLATVLANIDDMAFHEVLKKEKDPIKKAEFILSKIQTYPALAPFDQALRDFIKKSEETMKSPMGASTAIINDKLDKIKTKMIGMGNKFLNKFFAKADLKKLFDIKVNNVTLRDTLNSDTQLANLAAEALMKANEMIAANPNNNSIAPFGTELLKIKDERLDPYRPAIQEWITSVSDKIGNIGNKAGGFADKIINKALDLVDKFITGKDRKTGKKNEIVGPELGKIKGFKEALQKACEGTGYDELLRRLPNDYSRALFIRTKMADDENIKPFLLDISEFLDEKKDEYKSKINNAKDKVKGKGQEFLNYAKGKGIDLKNITKAEKDKLLEEWKASQVDDEEFEIEEGDTFTKRMMKRGKRFGKRTSKFAAKQLKKGKGLFAKGKNALNEASNKIQDSFKNGDFGIANIGGLIGSGLSVVGDAVSNLTETVNKHLKKNDTGAVDGDKAEEQRKKKEERRKKREEDKFKNEQRGLWKKLGGLFGKKGVHLDEDQQEDLMKQHGALLAGLGGGGGGFIGNVKDLIMGPGQKRWDAIKNFAKNPKVITAAVTAASAGAAYVLGKKGGEKKGKHWSTYKKFKDQDKGNVGALGYDDDKKQMGQIMGATAAVPAAIVANKSTKMVGHYANKVKAKTFEKMASNVSKKGANKVNKMLDKAARLEKAGNLKGANKALEKAAKMEKTVAKNAKNLTNQATKANKRALKFSKNGASMNGLKKGLGTAAKAAGGAFIGGTIANTIATKMNLNEQQSAAVTAAGAVAGAVVAGTNNPFMKLLQFLSKKLNAAAQKAITVIIQQLTKCIGKIAPKLAAKMTALSGLVASGAGLIIKIGEAVTGFADGMSVSSTRARFSLDKHATVTFGMKLTSGLVGAINMLTMGTLDLIFSLLSSSEASVLHGATSVAEWLYIMIGPASETAALAKYHEYCMNRAKILGVKREQLVTWEARYQDETGWGKVKNGAKSAVRSIGNFLAKGVAKIGNAFGSKIKADDIVASDEKHCADMLGFASKKIYKYWKSKKYDPCEKVAVDIANQHGGVKKVFEINMPTEEQVKSTKAKDQEKVKQYEERSRAQIQILEAMKKYVLDNKLAWLTNDITDEEFEKHMEESTKQMMGQFKSGAKASKNVKEFKEQDNKKHSGGGAGTSFGGSKDRLEASNEEGNVKKASHDSQAGQNQFGKAFKAIGNWVKSKFKEYKFNDREQSIMNSATAAIQEVHTNVDPTFYGNNPASSVKPGKGGTQSDTNIIFAGGNGGADSSSEGYFVKVKTEKVKQTSSGNKYVPGQSKRETNAKQPNKKHESDTYDMSGNTPKSTVMNSIVSDFAKNFGDELNTRLNILEEMHKENMRHNKVAEEFFTAALAMMSQIAKQSGNVNMGSKLDSMISQITM